MTVPLVVVTGFLGSGKTTLVNRILARRAARGDRDKLGIVVNELGAVGIDGALLGANGGGVRQVELPGGCVCCVLGDELDATLLELVDAAPLSAIVLETTGVAEPLPIAWALRRAPVCERVRLALVVTLVDATNFHAARSVSASVDAQVAYADVVLVTKAELVDPRQVDGVVEAVRELASRALIQIGSTDEHAAWLEATLADPPIDDRDPDIGPPTTTQMSRRPPHSHEGCHDPECRHTDAAHGIDSVAIAVPGVLDLEELEDQLAELPSNYVRIKGIVRAHDPRRPGGAPAWIAVHRVGLRVSSEEISPPQRTEGRMVALGPGVDDNELAGRVRAALA